MKSYFALRSYRDGGEHFDGQIGSEATPQLFLEALWAVMSECWRVIKPSGSVFVNLGDKRAGSGGHNNSGIAKPRPDMYGDKAAAVDAITQVIDATRRNAPDRYNQAAFGRPKSKMLLPHRFAIGCEDGLADPEGEGWIVRQDLVWEKQNGLPESVTDRTRDSHEYWFHLTKCGTYFSSVDEVRIPYAPDTARKYEHGYANEHPSRGAGAVAETWEPGAVEPNPLGKLPPSVWSIPTEPLLIPDGLGLPAHFAAFPQEWPRRLILGWSPSGICTVCGEGRRPVSDVAYLKNRPSAGDDLRSRNADRAAEARGHGGWQGNNMLRDATITGLACACTPRVSHRGKRGDWKEGRREQAETVADDWHQPGAGVPRRLSPNGNGVKIPPPPDQPMWEYHFDGWDPPPTRPAVVLDPFVGTGTTVGVARALGRVGVGVDLSRDYLRLASWRIYRSQHFAKTVTRTWADRQMELFDKEDV